MEANDYFDCVAGDGLHTETILVTPAMAKVWLERNLTNRDISAKHVANLADDIRTNKWVLTHQGIAFNTKRCLIDGQHRLTAIIKANKAVTMRVTFNVPAEYQAPIDSGLIRRVHDVLELTRNEVAICNALLLLETRTHARNSPAKVDGAYQTHQKAIAWASRALPLQRSVTANLLAGCVYAYPVAPRKVEEFARAFLADDHVTESAPPVALRRYVTRLRFKSSDRIGLTLSTLRCLHAHCVGEPLPRVVSTEIGFDYFTKLRLEKGL